ncbi:MAG: glycosyltransferase family 4 protein [Nitrososphaeria archaeon]
MFTVGAIGIDLNPPLNEGIKNTVYEIYNRIASKGVDVLLITKGTFKKNSFNSTYSSIEEVYGKLRLCSIPVIKQESTYSHLSGVYKFITNLPIYLKKICHCTSIEIFHIHTSFPSINFLIAFQVKTILKTEYPKVIATQYSSSRNPYIFGSLDLKSLLTPLPLGYTNFGYLPIDLVITLSKRLRDNFKKYFPKKIVWFPHIAIDTDKFKPDKKFRNYIRNQLSIDKETTLLLYAGDLTPTRGIEFFISTIKYLSKRHQVKGLIPLKDRELKINRYNYIIHLLKANGIEKYVEILGYRDDINCVINSSDIVLMPLRKNYGFMDLPRFLLEAMSCGKPVITTTVGAINEILYNGVNGVLCDPEDLKGFIISVKNLIDNPFLRYKISVNARKTILSAFDAEKMSDKLLRMYVSLMES